MRSGSRELLLDREVHDLPLRRRRPLSSTGSSCSVRPRIDRVSRAAASAPARARARTSRTARRSASRTPSRTSSDRPSPGTRTAAAAASARAWKSNIPSSNVSATLRGGSVPLVQPADRLVQRQHVVAAIAQHAESRLQQGGAHRVRPRPLVLVVDRDAVVAQDEQAALAPRAVADPVEDPQPRRRTEHPSLHDDGHRRRGFGSPASAVGVAAPVHSADGASGPGALEVVMRATRPSVRARHSPSHAPSPPGS